MPALDLGVSEDVPVTASPHAPSTLPPTRVVVPSHTSVIEVLLPPVEPGQYTSLAFTEALVESGIAGSIGSVGDALDNALMESTIGLYKTELIDREWAWTGRAEVERETAEWVRWFNADRLHSSIDYFSPIEHETRYRKQRPIAASIPEVA
jgi:hypothetical protein